jgi:outer membrane lipoprotein-sorting protein
MTDINKHIDNEFIDKHLDKLLELGAQIPKMPENLRHRIRTTLIQMEPESAKKNIFSFRWVVLPLAAAAVLVFFMIFPWQVNLTGSITWADVQKHLENVHTFSAKVEIKQIIKGESQIISIARIYHKDPGLTRSEIYEQYKDLDALTPLPQSIYIDKRKPGLSELLTFHADSRQAEWSTQIFRTIDPKNPPLLKMDLAAENWSIMKKLTEDNTTFIGDRIIGGIRAAGFSFECPAREIIRPPIATGQAYGKIYVKMEDAIPIYCEVEYTTILGEKTKWEITDMKWNEPLEKNLFNFFVPKGWHLKRISVETAEYTDTKLAPGISLHVGLDDKEPLITADDVIGVLRAEQVINPNTKIPSSMNVTLELKQSAIQRLHKQEVAHPESIIVVHFNRQTKVPAMLDNNLPERLTFDLSRLGYSLSEIEKKYFTKTTTIFEGRM